MENDVYHTVKGLYVSRFFVEQNLKSAMSYKPVPGDVFIVSYPKCGTTWMQHIVYSIYSGGVPPKDMTEFMTRTPFLELLGAEILAKMPRPGAIKTHLPYHLQPYSPDAKYIYVTRNPYDCCVSFYYHTKTFPAYKFENNSFDDFFEMFMRGKVDFGDYFDHQLSWYEHINDDNVLIVTYEDLKKDARSGIQKIADFLGDEYGKRLRENPDVLDTVVKVTSIEFMKGFNNEFKKWAQMADEVAEGMDGLRLVREAMTEEVRKKPITGDFVRKGIVGDWRNHFSEDQVKRLKERIAAKTKGSDLMSLWKDVNLP
ncbi:sulfotransferase ssu-1-like [Ixodes scapularis]